MTGVAHICWGGPTHEVDGVRFEFHPYLGPTFMTKRDGVQANQPVRENDPRWKPFEKWFAVYHALGKAWGMECSEHCVYCLGEKP